MNETLNLPAEVPQPPDTEQFVVPPHGMLEARGDLPAIGTFLTYRDGQPVSMDALVSVQLPDSNSPYTTVVVARDSQPTHGDRPRNLSLVTFNETPALDGRPVNATGGLMVDSPSEAALRLPDGTLRVDLKSATSRKSSIRWAPDYNYDRHAEGATVTVADTVKAKSLGYDTISSRQDRSHALRKTGRALLIAASIYGTLKTGGLADQSRDHHQEAASVVHTVLDPGNVPEVIDGVKVAEMSAENQAEVAAEHEEFRQTGDRIARSMQDLDDHNYDAIRSRGEAFRQAHAHEIMPVAQREQLDAELETTETNEQALEVFRKFLSYYDRTADFTSPQDSGKFAFDHSTPVEDTQAALRGIMSAYGPLPAPFLTEAGFRKILVMTPKDGIQGLGSFGKTDSEGETFLAVVSEEDAAHAARHELGHAEQSAGSSGGEATNLGIYTLSELISMPTDVSGYSAIEGGVERDAELYSTVLDLRDIYLDPDYARRFNSESAEDVLHKLATLENQPRYHGITDYLLSQNTSLPK